MQIINCVGEFRIAAIKIFCLRAYINHLYQYYYQQQKYSAKRLFKISPKAKFIFAMILAVFCGLFYLFLLSSVFEVKEIEISGNKKVSELEIKKIIDDYLDRPFLFFWKGKNIFLFKQIDIANTLFKKYLAIGEIKVRKKYPNKISMEIKEREIWAIGCYINNQYQISNIKYEETAIGDSFSSDSEKCYYIDESAVAFEEAPKLSGSLILVIKIVNEFNDSDWLGKVMIKDNFLSAILKIEEQLSGNNLKITEFLIENASLPDLVGISSEKWKIYFDIERDIAKQLKILKEVLDKKIKDDKRKNLEYIDLRVPERVYYK